MTWSREWLTAHHPLKAKRKDIHPTSMHTILVLKHQSRRMKYCYLFSMPSDVSLCLHYPKQSYLPYCIVSLIRLSFIWDFHQLVWCQHSPWYQAIARIDLWVGKTFRLPRLACCSLLLWDALIFCFASQAIHCNWILWQGLTRMLDHTICPNYCHGKLQLIRLLLGEHHIQPYSNCFRQHF